VKRSRRAVPQPEPVHAGSGYYFPKTIGPDGLSHYDCPMERGVEPCRCGVRGLQGDWRSSFDA
jgi:hypothetical protein